MENNIIPNSFISSSGLIKTYETGELYNLYALDEQYYPYKFDGWNSRKQYAIIDSNNTVIYPKQSALLEYQNNNKNTHKNINFVVDAFSDFKKYQDDLNKKNRMGSNSIFTKLNVEKSTEFVPNLYLERLKTLYNIFNNTYLSDKYKKQIIDINTFLEHFIKFIRLIAPVSPINRSQFIKSRFVPSSINGLTISFENIKPTADYKRKANEYIANPEFDHFLASAAKFGFFVDKNYPYSIVADLESPIMRSYAKKRGYFSLEEIFSKCYFKAYTADLDSLKNVILSFWNSYALAASKQIIDNKTSTETIYLNQITLETFENFFNINWQIRMYLYIRILEDNLKITQNKFESLYQESIKINKFSDTNNCLLYINQKIQELQAPTQEIPSHLTTPDIAIRMLSSQMEPLPTEGINF